MYICWTKDYADTFKQIHFLALEQYEITLVSLAEFRYLETPFMAMMIGVCCLHV